MHMFFSVSCLKNRFGFVITPISDFCIFQSFPLYFADNEVFWADSNHKLDQFEQSAGTSSYMNFRNLTITELTAEHDNLYLKCIEHHSSDSVEVKLDVLCE